MVMSMVVSRRPGRKLEPNLTNLHRISASHWRHNDPGTESASGGRRRHWFLLWGVRPPPMSIMTKPPPLFPASLCLPSLPSLLLERFKNYIIRTDPICVATSGVVFLLAWAWYVVFLMIVWWGPQGSIKGGQWGHILDQLSRDYARYQTVSKWREEVRSEVHIPTVYSEKEGTLLDHRFFPFDVIIRTRPKWAIVEMLLREKGRVHKLGSMVQTANLILENCSRDGMNVVGIPTTVLQMLPHHEQPPLPPYWIARSKSMEVDSIAIHNTDVKHPLSRTIKRCQTFLARYHATFTDSDLLCLAHHLGGIQLSNAFPLHHSRPAINNIFSLISSSKTNTTHEKLGGGNCHSRVGYAIFSNVLIPADQLRRTSSISSHVSTSFVAFPPGHPGSLCIPPLEQNIGISPYNEANGERTFQSTFAKKLLTKIESRNFDGSTAWGIATLQCNSGHASCCNQVTITVIDSFDAEVIAKLLDMPPNKDEQKHHLIFTSSKLVPSIPGSPSLMNLVSVKITELSDNTVLTRRKKESIQMQLRNKWRCEPGWLCNRCLMSSIYGSFSNCALTCGKCIADVLCNEDGTLSKNKQINVHVQVTRPLLPTSSKLMTIAAQQNRIPRIIHQTYFEEITIEKYPQLLRLQNTWKYSGWEYRFYTDATARQYIETSYPSRFLSVFDSLLPGAYKADFFRYLVLYKEGGIYADVDVMLNTNLDSFITPDLAFFAPTDAVGSFADEQFCVWNGLLGSAPAHPALTKVIEWMVNLVSSRGDLYDMERAVCMYSGVEKIENWKVRAEPGLMLSGPCALGLAINIALGNEPLSKFSTGLLKREGFNVKRVEGLNDDAIGNVMILLADKDDLAAFRFSDPERNILIATTDMPGLSKAPMMYERQNSRVGERMKQKPHYSISTKGQQLWGTHDVYADDFVDGEQVTLTVSRE